MIDLQSFVAKTKCTMNVDHPVNPVAVIRFLESAPLNVSLVADVEMISLGKTMEHAIKTVVVLESHRNAGMSAVCMDTGVML